MKRLLVSVCIPVFNGQQYIEETIRSVLAQTYRSIEIIVQDNASTDATWDLLVSLARDNPSIYPERNKENVGMARNWNLAFRRAKGDYIMLLSADDCFLDKCVERCIGIFSTNKVSAVTTNHYWLTGNTIRKRKLFCKRGTHTNFSSRVMLTNPFSINFSMFSRSFVERAQESRGLFREDVYTCDYDLWLKMATHGEIVYYLDEPLGMYRLHGENLSTQTRRMQRHTMLVLSSHRRYYRGLAKFVYLLTLLRFLVRTRRQPSSSGGIDTRLRQVLKLAILKVIVCQ
jgi:teichuronic acid biosynthesis glycosyltransferase TuaG